MLTKQYLVFFPKIYPKKMKTPQRQFRDNSRCLNSHTVRRLHEFEPDREYFGRSQKMSKDVFKLQRILFSLCWLVNANCNVHWDEQCGLLGLYLQISHYLHSIWGSLFEIRLYCVKIEKIRGFVRTDLIFQRGPFWVPYASTNDSPNF